MHLQLRLRLPGEERSVPVVRRVLGHALDALGVQRDVVEDLELVISEACTNVIDHAGPRDEYAVLVSVDGPDCTIEVCDEGTGFSHPPAADPGILIDPDAEHGRGVQLMRALVDQLDFTASDDRGTVVRLHKSLTHARASASA
jgi:serine/threonine-protein kinase RsbW